MNKNQCGAATLLLTSLITIATLMVTLGSSKGVFYHIKRAKNELEARKQHWAAEGGIECVYTKAKQLNAIPSSVSECQTVLSLSSLSITAGFPNTIHATTDGLTINKAFTSPGISNSGAIRSKSDLVINGSYTSSPDPSKSLGDHEWECTSVRYFDLFYATSYNTYHPWQVSTKPYSDFPDSNVNPQKCHPNNHSYGVMNLADTADDYKKDTDMDLFKDVFNVPRSDWFSVMSDKSIFGYVPYSLNSGVLDSVNDLGVPTFNTDCAEEIKQNVQNRKDVIWVHGGCEINNSDFNNISAAIDTYLDGSGIILVIHNGLLSVTGSVGFKGMLYHFISDEFVDSEGVMQEFDNWNQTENDGTPSVLDGVISTLSSTIPMNKQKVGYFQNGSFNPSGGFIMDAPGTVALFNAAMTFTYNRDVIEVPSSRFNVTTWYRGSWHD